MIGEITFRGLQPYLSFLGSFLQFGTAALLGALFLLLRPYARRRKYFVTWSHAWIALSVALFTIMVRYNILPVLPNGSPADSELRVRVLYFFYQVGKLGFYGMLIAGTLRYVRSGPQFPSIIGFTTFTLIYAMLSLWRSPDLAGIVVWQTPVAVVSLSYAASLMLRLPYSRRSLGSTLTGSCFTFGALVWLLYLAAFSLSGGAGANPLRFVVNYNTYFDLIWHLSLGFGMVVLLMEDVKNEVDAAHAELNVAHDNLRRASFYDSVTGSLNRQAFSDGLGLEAVRAKFGCAIVLDMDNLKDINDEYGHATGDRMLRYLVEVLRAELRAADKLYRWGGDEFLLLFPGADALYAGRRIKTILGSAPPLVLPDGAVLPIRVSVGSAAYADGEHLNDAIDAADRAMYADKIARKNALGAEVAQSA
ncbi:MAG: GGDEF domain-containing protein [Gemmatimonadota bacterium]